MNFNIYKDILCNHNIYKLSYRYALAQHESFESETRSLSRKGMIFHIYSGSMKKKEFCELWCLANQTHMTFNVYVLRCTNQYTIEVSVRFMTRHC